PVARDRMQTRQIRIQLVRRLEVHIERCEVQKGKVEVLRRWIIHVGYQRGRILRLQSLVYSGQTKFHIFPTKGPYRGSGNLIRNRKAEDCRMGGIPPDTG